MKCYYIAYSDKNKKYVGIAFGENFAAMEKNVRKYYTNLNITIDRFLRIQNITEDMENSDLKVIDIFYQ